jgi:phage terminase large subunit-like protein
VHCFSAEEPDRLRGPNLDGAWFDEIAACPLAEPVFANLQMALRIAGPKGDAPRLVVSTTPRPLPLLRQLMHDP